jgi:hypothetical protein
MNSVLILLLLVLPNVWATVRVAPVAPVGAVDAPEDLLAPVSIALPASTPFEVNECLMNGNGLPILDWTALEQWAETRVTAAQVREALELGRRAWLLHFRDAMGPSARLHETAEAWVLSSYEPRIAKAAGSYVAATRRSIAKLLDGVARFPTGERSILILLNSTDDYYNYVANYYPDGGEFAFSGGMYINHGCPHFVGVLADLAQVEPMIAHEMTHSALAYLRLPLWLDEGLAVNAEHRISVSHRHPRATVELLGQHLTFWNAERMQEFWAGTSFNRTDEGNALSYDLARSIVELLGREWQSFVRFVSNARREDAGAAAARAELQLDLGQLAAAALSVAEQPGWSPNPATWNIAVREPA